MKSILVLLEKRPYGGAEIATHLIVKLLANEGFNLTVATGTWDRIQNMSARALSLQYGILEHKGVRRAVACSLATPLNALSRLWVNEADDIICVSKSQARMIGHELPRLADKIKVVYNPLPNIPVARKRLQNTTIMYLGGDRYVKGFHIFLKASCKLLKGNSNAEFLLLGEYGNTNRLLIKTLKERFKGGYNLLGYLEHEEVLRFHAISHALLFPSILDEPLPYAVLEAMLSGTLPIASRVGGIPEIVKGTLAEEMLFEPGNIEECVNKIELVLAMSNEQVRDVGLGLREAVLKKFDLEVTRKKLLEIFLS